MAVIFTEGFDTYGGNGSSLDGHQRKWPSQSFGAFTVAAGRFGGHAVYFDSSFQRWMQTPVFAIGAITVSVSAKFTVFPSIGDGPQAFLSIMDSSSNIGINVALTPTGEVAIYLGGSQLAVTTGLALTANTWHSFELSVVIGNTTGEYDLHVDGASVLANSNVDTQPGSSALINVVRIGKNANSSMLLMFDDFIVNDDDAAWLHDFKITTLFPTADAGPNDGTPSSGSDNYAMIDDAGPADADSTYVDSDAGDEDRFTSSSTVDGSSIHAVTINVVCRQTDATPFDVAPIANQPGTPQAIGSSDYVTRSQVFATNPDTSQPWTPAEVNSAEFGFEIQ